MATKRQKSKPRRSKPKLELEGGKREIKLKMVLPPELPTFYVDNVNVVHTPSEFTLSFLQARPPLFSEQAQLDSVKEVEARCVARLVVSPIRMQLVLQTLMANFQKYVEANLKSEKGNGNDNNNTDTDTT